jgi:hypothetical protein
MKSILLPSLISAGYACFYDNCNLEFFCAPQLENFALEILAGCPLLETVIAPKVTSAGNGIFFGDSLLQTILAPIDDFVCECGKCPKCTDNLQTCK